MLMHMNKHTLSFFVKSSLIYVGAYLAVGAIAYQLITKQFYVGDNAVFTTYLRSEANAAEWAHTNMWLVPGLAVRAMLISLVLLPFVGVLRGMSFVKRSGVLFALLFVLIHLAAAAPSPGNIEGLIYMKPELVSSTTFFSTQPEMIAQCLVYAVGVSWILRPKKPADKKSA